MSDTIVGNDISVFQGNIDFDTYKSNANFLLIKASEGNGVADPKFLRNQSEARRVKIPHGYYHFARPDLNNTPQAEAAYFLSVIGQLQEGEVLCLDYEPNWDGDAIGWCKAFLDEVYDKSSVRPLIYLNQEFIAKYDWKSIALADYGLWVAAYTHDPKNNTFITGAWQFASMQQWTDNQAVPGIQGAVDGDVFFGSADVFNRYGYHEVAPNPPNPVPTPCEDELNKAKATIVALNHQIADLQTETTQEKGIIQRIKDFLASEISFG